MGLRQLVLLPLPQSGWGEGRALCRKEVQKEPLQYNLLDSGSWGTCSPHSQPLDGALGVEPFAPLLEHQRLQYLTLSFAYFNTFSSSPLLFGKVHTPPFFSQIKFCCILFLSLIMHSVILFPLHPPLSPSAGQFFIHCTVALCTGD